MTEAKNKPSSVSSPPSSRVTGARLANSQTEVSAHGGEGSTPPPDGTRLRIVTVAPGKNSMPDVEVPSRDRRDPYVGAVIDGRYKVEAVLGEGGMGVVYRCTHTIIGKKLALKVLRADLARDGEVTERFLNEAKAASAIGNPHIIDISDFGQLPDGSTYFVMEFLTGEPLTSTVQHDQPMPLERLLHVASQLGEGLAAAHAAGIVHRDLKPDNIFLIERGAHKDFVKILDFGIAKVSNTEGKLTRAGAVFGTPHYMSPEQAAGTPVDQRGDIYSLGVILYELSTGRVPFDSDNFMGVLTQHLYKQAPAIREIAPNPEAIPEGLEAIIAKCLAKRPEHRYQTMHELLADIEALRAGVLPNAARERPQRFAAPSYYDDVRGLGAAPRSAVGRVAIVAAVTLAVGVAGYLWLRPEQPKPVASPESPPAAAARPTPDPAAPKQPAMAPGPAIRQVLVATEPVAAQIYRGEEDLGKSPVSIDVPEGQQVELTIRGDGYKELSVVIDGSERRRSIKLESASGSTKGARPGGAPAKTTAKPQATTKPPATKRPALGGGEIIDPWSK